MKKRVIVLGSTGSIGLNTLKVIEDHPDRFEVVGLTAGTKVEELSEQVRRLRPRWAALQDESAFGRLEAGTKGSGARLLAGADGVAEVAAQEGVDLVVVAITGAAALKPVLSAVGKGRVIGLANKETLVMAGQLVMESARASGAKILPIDSEHSAIFQCLEEHAEDQVRRLLLTSSGGPLKDVPVADFPRLTKQQVMNHPRWKMGPKITVDSATMMNKALEVIEARWLFGVPVEKIEIIVHPEAIVHSMVEYVDGSVLAQLAVTDMRIPIQYAMSYPERLPSSLEPLDLVALGRLTFEAPQRDKFPCLDFGAQAARAGGTLPAVFNAANEACVKAFLEDKLPFTQIPVLIESVLKQHRVQTHPNLEGILAADRWAQETVAAQLPQTAGVSR